MGASVNDGKAFLTVVNLKTGDFETDVELPDRTEGGDYFSSVGVTGNSKFALVGRNRGGVDVIDIAQGKFVAFDKIVSIPQFCHHMPQGGGAMFAYGARLFAVHGETGQLKRIREKDFYHAELTPDGRRLVAINCGNKLNVWDVLYFPAIDHGDADAADAPAFSIRIGGLDDGEFIKPVKKGPDRW